MINSFYGKTIEDKRRHIKAQIVTSDIQSEKKLRQNYSQDFMILNEDVSIFQMKNTSVYLNKPIFIGFSVLEKSKRYMYHLHYDVFKSHYGENIKLLYTDTDSFIYNVQTSDIYKDLTTHFSHLMDFSDYSDNHQLKSNENKKKIGFLKDETNGDPIEEFIAIKSKMYIIKTGNRDSKRAKGVQKRVLNTELNRQSYYDCLFNDTVFSNTMTRLASKKHKILAIEEKKMLLSPFDDKRYIFNDKISSLAHGHYKISSEL